LIRKGRTQSQQATGSVHGEVRKREGGRRGKGKGGKGVLDVNTVGLKIHLSSNNRNIGSDVRCAIILYRPGGEKKKRGKEEPVRMEEIHI